MKRTVNLKYINNRYFLTHSMLDKKLEIKNNTATQNLEQLDNVIFYSTLDIPKSDWWTEICDKDRNFSCEITEIWQIIVGSI